MKTLIGFFICLYGLSVFGVEPSVSVSLDPTEATLGDRLKLVFDMVHAKDSIVRSEQCLLADVPVITRASDVQSAGDGDVRTRHIYELAVLQLGEVVVASGAVQLVSAEVSTNGNTQLIELPFAPVIVTIKSVLTPEERAVDLQTGTTVTATDGIFTQRQARIQATTRELHKPPMDYRLLMALPVIALFTLLLTAGLLYWFVFRKPVRTVKPPPRIDPAKVAREALAELRGEGFHERGEYEPFYTRLSGIVRSYIERQFDLNAPDQTTEEFLQVASTTGSLSESQQALVGDFLQEADLVKFAKASPEQARMEQAWDSAKRLVDEPVAPPAAPQPAGAAAIEPARPAPREDSA